MVVLFGGCGTFIWGGMAVSFGGMVVLFEGCGTFIWGVWLFHLGV